MSTTVKNMVNISRPATSDYQCVLGIDLGESELFTFSDYVYIYGKKVNKYSVNKIGISVITWFKEHPLLESEIDNCNKKIEEIKSNRKSHIYKIINRIIDENPYIKFIIMEHDLSNSNEMIEEGLDEIKHGRKKQKQELIKSGWKKYIKGLSSMIDDAQSIIKKVCNERGIYLIQTPEGWVSTYRCSTTGESFTKNDYISYHNYLEKQRCEEDYKYNRSVHNINNLIQKVINSNPINPNYELAKLVGNQEIRLHNSKFHNDSDKLKLINKDDIINAKEDDKGYLVVIPDRKLDVIFAGYNSICKIRKYTCPICEQIHDRDINAAINIKKKGIEILNEIYAKT